MDNQAIELAIQELSQASGSTALAKAVLWDFSERAQRLAEDAFHNAILDNLAGLKKFQNISSDWHLALQRFLPGSDVLTFSPSRKAEVLESREKIVEILRAVEGDLLARGLNPADFRPSLSLSHSRGSCLVAVALFSVQVRESIGLGVDLESPSRMTVHPELVEKFSSEPERALGLGPLLLWTVKEALFKSDSESKGRELGDYVVEEWNPQSGRGRASCTKARQGTEFHFVAWASLPMAVALSRPLVEEKVMSEEPLLE